MFTEINYPTFYIYIRYLSKPEFKFHFIGFKTGSFILYYKVILKTCFYFINIVEFVSHTSICLVEEEHYQCSTAKIQSPVTSLLPLSTLN